MTALTAPHNTTSRSGEVVTDPVAASEKIYAGALVCLDASGNAIAGKTATGLTARGVAEHSADNSDGAAGDISLSSERGHFHFANDDTDTIDRTHIGKSAYIVDDHTVAKNDGSSTRSKAGTILDVDDAGVWVNII